MSDWIKVVTEGGITRIKMKAICAYQITEDMSQLLIYTKDNSLFQVTKDAKANFESLDSHFKIE
ncbi:MAG: hypothetical protein ACPF9I_01265 [Candidatus Thalassarchaeaceae archaeon]